MKATGYAIRFDVGGVVVYAGKTPDNALGFAPTLESAEIWPSEEIAGNFLRNGYGPSMSAVGSVIRVEDGAEVRS